MNTNNRFCTLIGHEQLLMTHLCIFEDCKLLQRVCCLQCINEGIHNHDQYDNQHIIQEEEIQTNYQKLRQQKNDKNTNNKPIDFSKRKYNIKYIDSNNKGSYAVQISNNEKYLAYGGYDRILKIYDIQEDKIIKGIKFEGVIATCSFTFDSSKLYVGCEIKNGVYGYAKVVVFNVEKNFKKIFQQNIHSKYIYSIITIQNQYSITSCAYDNKIIKTDVKRKKQLFKLKGQDTWVYVIDYNQSYDFIINGSRDGSIQLWNCSRRRLIINKKQAHQQKVCQIQFINNGQNVLSLGSLGSNDNLYKWKIDLINNDLIKLQEYKDHNPIFSFSQINQNQILLLICKNHIKILDEKGQNVYQIDHQCGDSFWFLRSRQLDNASYIIIATDNKIMLASALG